MDDVVIIPGNIDINKCKKLIQTTGFPTFMEAYSVFKEMR